MVNRFCSYCDSSYLARLLCLYHSLRDRGGDFLLFVLCFDDLTETTIRGMASNSLVAIPLQELLVADPGYAAIRSSRKRFEFYFSSTAALVKYCFAKDPLADRMTYLDADLYFYGAVAKIFDQQGDASIAIVPHRFPGRLSGSAKYGTFNVAWVSFRRDLDGLACVEWWRARCLEWCHDYLDGTRFADQGYLDEFPRRFAGVKILDHPGINAAPWNMEGIRLSVRGTELFVNEQPLLFYHFQGIREIAPGWFDPGFMTYHAPFTPALRELVYFPYLQELVLRQEQLRVNFGIVPSAGYHRTTTGHSMRDAWERAKARWVLPLYRRLRGQLLYCPVNRLPQ